MSARVDNWPLLIKTVEHIIQHPETWDQRTWVSGCGTYACIAGWAAQLGGMKPVRVPIYNVEGGSHVFSGQFKSLDEFLPVTENPHADQPQVPERFEEGSYAFWQYMSSFHESTVFAREAAISLLGLDKWGASALFSGENRLLNIIRIVAELAEEDGVELSEVIKATPEWSLR